ncbi:MAG: CRTAC1 family protein [Acidobacteriota bacterium]
MTSRQALLGALLSAAASTLCLACGRSSAPDVRNGPTAAAGPAASDRASSDWFVDRAAATGLDFVHFNGMSGALYYAEHMGPGVALFDYDNDGDLDVFIPQGQMLGTGKKIEQATFPPKRPLPLKGRLFRNDLQVNADGTRTLRFTDVTDASGLNANGYGMGVATGDYNNDGCVDLYVTALGRNQLFRNNCNGTFSDVSKQSRTDDTGWSTSAAFVDYDRDGWPDLFVGHYLAYTTDANSQCYSVTGKPDYCPPHVYSAQPSHLFHNNRDGTFTEVTVAAGMSREFGPALGVSTADFNGDGWPDIYVANDGQPNQLWMNQHDGTFRNTGLLSGTALSGEGEAKSSMGVDAGDFDNDGDEDLFVAELTGQGADLYVNDGSGVFVDRSARSRIRFATLPFTGFGAAWFDYDNDGWLDLLMVSGAVTSIEDLMKANDPFPLRQRKQLLRNLGTGEFEDVTARAGAVFQQASVARGAAFGDLDNDGDTDVVVGSNNGPVQLLINEIGSRNHWIGIRAVTAAGGGQAVPAAHAQTLRDAVGARVSITRADGSVVWRRARAEGSYASANDPRVLVGLGSSAAAVKVRVTWPDGKSEEWAGVPVDRYTTLQEGTGK